MTTNTAINDPEMLETLYWVEGLSMWQIAERMGCSKTTVYRRMNEYGIDRRGVAYRSRNAVEINPIHIRSRQDGYVGVENYYRGESYRFYLHQLLAIAEGADPHKVFSEDYHTHHKNEVKWDNRPENLEVLSRSDHMKHHADKNNFGREVKYTDSDLLWWINAFVSEMGFGPTESDVEGWPGPDTETYRNRFGSWKTAIRKAGWKVPNHTRDRKGRVVEREDPIEYEGES